MYCICIMYLRTLVWQDGARRILRPRRCRAAHSDDADETRAAHSSPRPQIYAQHARGHRGKDSSQALDNVISSLVSPRTSKLEPRSQTARVAVGALERKNFLQSKSLRPFCAIMPLKTSSPPPKVKPIAIHRDPRRKRRRESVANSFSNN